MNGWVRFFLLFLCALLADALTIAPAIAKVLVPTFIEKDEETLPLGDPQFSLAEKEKENEDFKGYAFCHEMQKDFSHPLSFPSPILCVKHVSSPDTLLYTFLELRI